MNREIFQKTIDSIPKRKRHFIVTEKGLFIKERSLNYVTGFYQRLLREEKKQIQSKREILEELITQAEVPYYLRTEKLLTGYVLPKDSYELKDIPSTNGRLISAEDYIDPEDRLIKEHPHITLMNHKDYLAKIKINDFEYIIHKHAFERFVERGKKSERIKKMSGKPIKAKRDFMKLLYGFLKASMPVERKNVVKQILKYNFQDAKYRISHKWTFVITDGNVVRTCYEENINIKKKYIFK